VSRASIAENLSVGLYKLILYIDPNTPTFPEVSVKIDVAKQIGAVTRTVLERDHNGRQARVVIATRAYDAGIADVWDAITNPERIPRWFLPITGELRLGGRYQLQGNAGGEITGCEPPRHLAVTWEWGGEVSWLTVQLAEQVPAHTFLELEHVAYVDDDRWEQYGPGAVGVGWDMTLMGLDQHLSTGASVDPAEAMAWSGSEEGKQFITGSSDDWRRASVVAGTDEAQARAAAGRTTAAYTGQPEPPKED
jgi:uncharacterized protein YndB with AHSA1/START domain